MTWVCTHPPTAHQRECFLLADNLSDRPPDRPPSPTWPAALPAPPPNPPPPPAHHFGPQPRTADGHWEGLWAPGSLGMVHAMNAWEAGPDEVAVFAAGVRAAKPRRKSSPAGRWRPQAVLPGSLMKGGGIDPVGWGCCQASWKEKLSIRAAKQAAGCARWHHFSRGHGLNRVSFPSEITHAHAFSEKIVKSCAFVCYPCVPSVFHVQPCFLGALFGLAAMLLVYGLLWQHNLRNLVSVCALCTLHNF